MTNYLLFLFQASCVFGGLLVFYYLFLGKLTFHTVNRWVLLSFIPLSILIPTLDFGFTPLFPETFDQPQIFGPIEAQTKTDVLSNQASSRWLNFTFGLQILYWTGFSIYLLMLMRNAVKLFQIKRSSQKISSKKYSLFLANTPLAFSCFNWVFVPKGTDYEDSHPILKHEEAHVRSLHTVDLLITELFIALTWFNPFVFLFRKLLKSIHEYQADQYVIGHNITRSHYLSVMAENLIPNHSISFSSHFNGLTIKNRIEMITKNKSKKRKSIRYVLILPLCGLLLMAFAAATGSKPSIFPIKDGEYKRIASGFGNRVDPVSKTTRLHGGVDISANTGTAVMATGAGTITKASDGKQWGNLVIIDHGNGFETWYAHLDAISVEEGKTIKLGEVLGSVGNTGRSFGPHLHYEVHVNGKRVDPKEYYDKK